jgi:hypothetical protein
VNKLGPKPAAHPSIGEICPGCNRAFEEGDYTTLIPIGPGGDGESREKARNGKAYDAVALEVHWECSMQAYT